MKDEEKAKQLYRKYRETDFARESAAFNAAMEMAEWKDKQFEMAIKRIEKKVIELFGQKLLDDFKQAMMDE